jgi:cell division protein FtsQ
VLQRTQRFIRTLGQITPHYQRSAEALEYADLRYPDGYALRLRGVSTVSRERALEMAKRHAAQTDNKKTRPTEGMH